MSLAAAMFTHGLDDRGRGAGPGEVLDEGTIDLDLVERETLQIAQRRIAGAEIVERDANAQLAQLVQGISSVASSSRISTSFGDLQFEPTRRRAPMPQALAATFSASVRQT